MTLEGSKSDQALFEIPFAVEWMILKSQKPTGSYEAVSALVSTTHNTFKQEALNTLDTLRPNFWLVIRSTFGTIRKFQVSGYWGRQVGRQRNKYRYTISFLLFDQQLFHLFQRRYKFMSVVRLRWLGDPRFQ